MLGGAGMHFTEQPNMRSAKIPNIRQLYRDGKITLEELLVLVDEQRSTLQLLSETVDQYQKLVTSWQEIPVD